MQDERSVFCNEMEMRMSHFQQPDGTAIEEATPDDNDGADLFGGLAKTAS